MIRRRYLSFDKLAKIPNQIFLHVLEDLLACGTISDHYKWNRLNPARNIFQRFLYRLVCWTNRLLFWQFKHFLVSENKWFYQRKIIVWKKPYQLKTDLRYAKKNKMKTSNRVRNKDHAIALSVMSEQTAWEPVKCDFSWYPGREER